MYFFVIWQREFSASRDKAQSNFELFSDFSLAGLVEDSFGGYPPAFYMSGALVALSGVIVLLVLFVKQDHQDPAEAAIRGALLVVEKCTVV